MRPTTTSLRLAHLPALDGIRAISVLAVFLYHTRFPWAAGGFLGVESFFVISGFLITSLLLREWMGAGRIDLKAFWLRRARRLLPALWALLLAAPVAAAVWMPGALPRLWEDTLAALVYATNWAYIVRQIPYFEQFAQPPLLQHLWSLAVEEQFYIVWPLIVVAATRGLKIATLRDARRLVPVLVVAALASSVWMALSFDPQGDASRVYFGTDTRAAGFLVGALLAAVWQPAGERGRRWEGAAGWAALGALLVAFVWVDEFTPWLYRGGFLAIAALTAVVIRLALVKGTSIEAVLASRPMAWVGARSYGLYLWHWPVVVLTGPALVTMPWQIAVSVQALVTLCLSEASYRWVESPIRSLGFVAWARAMTAAWLKLPTQARVGAAAALLAIVSFPVLTAARTPDAEPAQADAIVAGAPSSTPTVVPTLEPTATPSTMPTRVIVVAAPTMALALEGDVTATQPAPTARPTQVVVPTRALDVVLPTAQPVEPTTVPTEPPAQPTAVQPVAPAPSGYAVTLIGDSVMLGSQNALATRLGTDVVIDAVVGRRMGDLFAVIDDLAARGKLAPVVVVHLGSNQPYDAAVFDDVMNTLLAHGVQHVIFINVRRPVRWVEGLNQQMAEGVARYPQAQLIDWFTLSNANDDWFIPDGTHLTGTGIGWYVDAIATTLGR